MVIISVVIALGGVVLSEHCDTGVVSDQTEVTDVPSVLAESERRAYSCQSRHVWLDVTSPFPSRGRDGGEVMSLLRCAAKVEGGVAADLGLGVKPVLLGSARPRSFGPSLVDVSWAARPAN
jgi:hypothetical protein